MDPLKLQQMRADLESYRASKQRGTPPTGAPSASGIQRDLAAFRASKMAPEPAPEPERNLLQKIGDFVAPTATKSIEKLGSGQGLGLRDVAGSALEIGSFLLPVGALARFGGMGIRGLQALSLAQKAKLGAGAGALSGAAAEGGRAVGEEGTTLQDIATRTLTGAATGAAGGAALPAGGALLAGTARKAVPAASIMGRGAKNLATNTGRGVIAPLQEEAAIRALPEPQRVLRRAGFDERSTKFISEARPGTRQGFKEMIDIAEKGITNPRYRVQPKQVIGQSFLKRVDAIQKDSTKARNEINKVAKTPAKVDITPAYEAFEARLASRGVKIGADGRLYSTGNIPSSELKYYQSIIKEIKQVTRGNTTVSNTKAHQLRQRLFATLEAEARKGTQPGVRPFSDKVDQDINLFRREIAKALGKKYQEASQRFAENEKILRDVAKYAGVPNDWEKISSKDLKFGEILLRTLGNASDKPLQLLGDVEKLAKGRGGKFNDSILDLADFADSLEDLYGISKTRGFEGGIARGTQQGVGVEAPASATQAILRTIQAAFRSSNQDKIEALKKSLRYR